METKSLIFGLAGFFLGGLIVSVAATTFNQPDTSVMSDMSMGQMTGSLKDKQGDSFDEAFISGMIVHHQGAIEMAELAEANAKHDEIKKMSRQIITAQQAEIDEMKRWQADWGYATGRTAYPDHQMH